MRFEKATFTIRTSGKKAQHEQVEGYEFEEQVKEEAVRFGVHKDENGNWGVTDLRTGLLASMAKESTRKQAVASFELHSLPKLDELYGTERYSKMCDEFLDIVCPEDSENELLQRVSVLEAKLAELEWSIPKASQTESKIDALIAECSAITVAGKTSCAVYLAGIEKDSPEMEAAKAAGARFGNHKKYGKCWYMPV